MTSRGGCGVAWWSWIRVAAVVSRGAVPVEDVHVTERDESSDAELFSLLNEYVEGLQRGEIEPPDAASPSARAASPSARQPELASLLECLSALERLAPDPGEAPDAAGILADGERPEPAPTVAAPLDGVPPDAVPSIAESLPTVPPPGAASSSVGDYELLGELGRGGMGVVFHARQRSLDRSVAMKMILPGHLASDEQVRRFQSEARGAARLRHPNIVSILDAGQLHGQHYFTMQFIAGDSLARLLAEKRIDLESGLRLLAAVARAVDYLHRSGVVHRDLKPSNILVDQQGVPYVTDFGLAKFFSLDNDRTATGVVVGTPSYMAPEQAAARVGEIGPRSDVYGLGAILYELLTGRPPFVGDTPLDTLLEVLERQPERPSRLNRNVPRDLELIALECLAKSPDDRYGSAAELADELERYLCGEAVQVRPPGPVERLLRWSRREPALASRLGVIAVFYAVQWINYSVLHVVDYDFHIRVSGYLALWVIASFAFQQLLGVERWSVPATYAWGGVDVLLYSLILGQADGVASPLVVGYPLLIVGAGLWFRERLVLFVTALSLVSYLALVVDFYVFRSDLQERFDVALDRHVFFCVMLVSIGIAVAYQVQRVRTLSRYFDRGATP